MTLKPVDSRQSQSDRDKNHKLTVAALDEDHDIGESIQSGLLCGANEALQFGRFEGALYRFKETVRSNVHTIGTILSISAQSDQLLFAPFEAACSYVLSGVARDHAKSGPQSDGGPHFRFLRSQLVGQITKSPASEALSARRLRRYDARARVQCRTADQVQQITVSQPASEDLQALPPVDGMGSERAA